MKDEYETRYPFVPWREPVIVQIAGLQRLTCRICIARRGLRAADVATSPFCFDDVDAFEEHMQGTHS